MTSAFRGALFFLCMVASSALYTNCGQPPMGDASSPSITQQLPDESGLTGGESSGGGNSVKSPTTGKYVLLDYFVFSPTQHAQYTTTSGSPLVKTDYRYVEFDNGYEALPDAQPAYATVLQRLNVWKTRMPNVQSRILNDVRLSFVALPSVPQAGRYDLNGLASQYPSLEIQPLACFDAERAEAVWSYNIRIVLLNETIWNQLDLNSQAGLILHEMLRQLQLGNSVPLSELGDGSDKALQDLTSKIMLTNP